MTTKDLRDDGSRWTRGSDNTSNTPQMRQKEKGFRNRTSEGGLEHNQRLLVVGSKALPVLPMVPLLASIGVEHVLRLWRTWQ